MLACSPARVVGSGYTHGITKYICCASLDVHSATVLSWIPPGSNNSMAVLNIWGTAAESDLLDLHHRVHSCWKCAAVLFWSTCTLFNKSLVFAFDCQSSSEQKSICFFTTALHAASSESERASYWATEVHVVTDRKHKLALPTIYNSSCTWGSVSKQLNFLLAHCWKHLPFI